MSRKLQANTTKDFLKNVPLPTHGGRYTPISHTSIIDQSLNELAANNLEVKAELYRSTLTGNIANGIVLVDHGSELDMKMVLAWGNSYDKSTKFTCGIGAYIMSTKTFIFAGNLSNFIRKHTGKADQEAIEKIKEQISKELELASEMQKLLFPQELPSNKKMDISGRYIPRHAVGGDFYDFIPLGDEEYIICIGDVSGKGITAALLMANFQATIRTLFKYQRFELTFLMEELNKLVMKNAKGEKFITFFIAHYNAYTRQLQYVNAGHNQPFILSGKNTTLLTEGCIGLGMLDELPFVRVGKMQMQAKSTMVLFTDGVVELENEKGAQFGVEQLIKQVRSFSALKMEDMNDIIFSKLEDWKGSLPYVDDTAIFSCKFF